MQIMQIKMQIHDPNQNKSIQIKTINKHFQEQQPLCLNENLEVDVLLVQSSKSSCSSTKQSSCSCSTTTVVLIYNMNTSSSFMIQIINDYTALLSVWVLVPFLLCMTQLFHRSGSSASSIKSARLVPALGVLDQFPGNLLNRSENEKEMEINH